MRRGISLVCCAVLATACATTGARPRPFPTSDDATAKKASRRADALPLVSVFDGHAVSSTALALRGAPYRAGGAHPSGFDCSGFVQYVFVQHGMWLPRVTAQQFAIGDDVPRDELAPGDLVFFTTTAPGASHVGIVIGRDEFVHAPSSRGAVRIESLRADYWSRRFVGAKRPAR